MSDETVTEEEFLARLLSPQAAARKLGRELTDTEREDAERAWPNYVDEARRAARSIEETKANDLPPGSAFRLGPAPKGQTEHFYPCEKCGSWVDRRSLAEVIAHEEPHSEPRHLAVFGLPSLFCD